DPTSVQFSSSSSANVIAYGVTGQPFVLDGTRSHDNEVINTYNWTQTSGPFQFSTTQGNLVSVVPQTAGLYVFTLSVTANVGLTSCPRTLYVSVVPASVADAAPPEVLVSQSGGTVATPETPTQPLVV